MAVSLAEVRNAQRRTNNLYDTYFTRQLSAPITAVLARFGTPPNLVTLFNVGVGLLGCYLIAFGTQSPAILLGVGMVHLYAVLDSVDGELARLLNRRSAVGVVLEVWSAYLIIGVFPLALALYLTRLLNAHGALTITLVYLTLGRFAMPAVRRALTEVSPPSTSATPPAGAAALPSRAPGLLRVLDEQVLHPTNVRLVLTMLVALQVSWSALAPLLLWVFLAYIGAFLMREGGILYLIIFRDLLSREAARVARASGGP